MWEMKIGHIYQDLSSWIYENIRDLKWMTLTETSIFKLVLISYSVLKN